MADPQAKTLFDRIWENHVVGQRDAVTSLIYIDLHLIHELSSPQAFESLALNNRKVRRPDATLAVPDHNVPTTDRDKPVKDPESALQIRLLEENTKAHKIEFFSMHDIRQGIVHIISPEQGLTQPGMSIVCGDSHTSTHGALGAWAFGIGTSEVEHVLATQTLVLRKPANMRITVKGELLNGITSKDLALHIIGVIGAKGATGHVIEYAGPVIEALSVEARMTLCNMTIEAGGRSGLVAPDDKTIRYLKGRPRAPKDGDWDKAVAFWATLKTDAGARFDKEVVVDAKKIEPQVTWGTSPEDVISISGRVPDPTHFENPERREAAKKALQYMGLKPGTLMRDILVDRVFIGSCTNSRIEDLRSAAKVIKGRRVADNIIEALVVPGSGLVKAQAEKEGLDKIFKEAGFEWREPGCSMCLGLNPDKVGPGERCASTSNRNFPGRQGPGARTHLLSPAMAAVAAIVGKLADVREYE
ncbi:MAG: 3-isopropylmalate dehydratase large subunit [Proteobacteria bacterium]|nr:3-isopropylmalate dehydratase large subunit [Pseudomonadota bacterium]MCH8321611.1 3-isopropylmalate dehydratase large subunit [Pseudomonadota bacterium]